MTTASRLAAVEAQLSPTQLVLRWLDEAHAYGDLDAYVRSLVDLDPRDYPLNRLWHGAHDGTRAMLRGRPAAEVNAAVRRALRATTFRFELVTRINVVTHDTLGRETLIGALVALRLALLTHAGGPADGSGAAGSASDVAACRAMLRERRAELRAVEQARSTVEARYLDGRDARFPELAKRWSEQTRWLDDLVTLATRLAELDRLEGRNGPEEPADEEQSDDAGARAAVLVADLVEPARVTMLEKLDEPERAATVAARWLRSSVTLQINRRHDGPVASRVDF